MAFLLPTAAGTISARYLHQCRGRDQGGGTGVGDVRDLVGFLAREDAQIGVLISLNQPTSAMRSEAAAAGFYKHPGLSAVRPASRLRA